MLEHTQNYASIKMMILSPIAGISQKVPPVFDLQSSFSVACSAIRMYPDISPSGHMRSEITDSKDCPETVHDTQNCGSCPNELNDEVKKHCDQIIYCYNMADYPRYAFQFNTTGPSPDPCVSHGQQF